MPTNYTPTGALAVDGGASAFSVALPLVNDLELWRDANVNQQILKPIADRAALLNQKVSYYKTTFDLQVDPTGSVDVAAAMTAATAKEIFWLPGTYLFASDATVGDANTTHRICRGAILAVNNGVTVTLHGAVETKPGQTWTALTGTGTVVTPEQAIVDGRLHFTAAITADQISQAQVAGAGAAAGLALSVRAQPGQAQTGTNANNAGGDIQIRGGAAGTGGSGAAGAPGTVELFADTASMLKVETVSTALALLLGSTWSTFVLQPAQPPGLGTQNGGNFAISGQQGQDVLSGFNKNGGDLILSGGNAGTGGTGGTPGKVHVSSSNLVVDGTIASPSTLELILGSTPVVTATSSGMTIATAGPLTVDIEGSPALELDTSGSHFTETLIGGFDDRQWLDQNGVLALSFVLDGASATSLLFAEGAMAGITQSTRAGTGADAGSPLTILAQAGQQQTGGAANNNGGDIIIGAGAAGTGGSGAAGTGGSVTFSSGATPIAKLEISNAGFGPFPFINFGTLGGVRAQTIESIATSGDAYYIASGHVYLGTLVDPTAWAFVAGTMTANIAETSVTISQSDNVTNSATAAPWTIHAPNATGTGATGGALTLQSGTGTTAAGAVTVKAGSTTRMTANATGLGLYAATPVAQASRVGQLTDSTAGTPGTTLAAVTGTTYSTDIPTIRNWIASLAAKINALELAAHNLGATA